MRTENLAIVYVDIAGFAQLTSLQSREENERMLRRFDSVVRPAVRGFDWPGGGSSLASGNPVGSD